MRRLFPVAVFLAVALSGGAAQAQLSPGPLSSAHEHLEGLTRCSSCHQLGNRAVEPKCLGCHTEIAARVTGGRGLHARPEYATCSECHVEHQGRDFELVHWPDGPARFDHTLTGHELAGAHAKLECRACHRPEHVADAAALRESGKRLDRTWLGVETTCAGCHSDPHVKRLGLDCARCHGEQAWKPAPGFSHEVTRYPLTGRHAEVACDRCHRPAEGNAAAAWTRFEPLTAAECVDCHRDPHSGSLGARCAECHSTAGWKRIAAADFDHSRTRYPLEGRHRQVRCESCHRPDQGKPRFAACTDCHRDEHGAAAANRPTWARCESCHSVQGYRPADFDFDRHDRSPFPLRGAHRAVPCLACHQPQGAARFELSVAHAACVDCHADPHRGALDRYAESNSGCTACHDEQGWRPARFDHARTRFALEGGHARIDCARCHGERSGRDFGGLRTECVACHEDVHQGQLIAQDGSVRPCRDCHVSRDWFAEKFDHERDSRFALRGGHENVACIACHAPMQEGNERLLRFRPVPTDCRACHATGVKAAEGGKP